MYLMCKEQLDFSKTSFSQPGRGGRKKKQILRSSSNPPPIPSQPNPKPASRGGDAQPRRQLTSRQRVSAPSRHPKCPFLLKLDGEESGLIKKLISFPSDRRGFAILP